MSLFRLVAKIGIDSSEFTAGLKKAEGIVSTSMAAIGSKVASAFSIAAVAAFISHVTKAAGEIGDLADQLDLTTKQVQQLQFAASAAGVPFDALASAINKVRAAQASALSGDDNSLKLFKRLGVDPNQPAFDILQQAGFTEDKAALFDLLGTKAAKVFNALRDIQDLGPLEMISESDIRRTDDALDRLSANARKTTNIILNLLGVVAAIQQAPADLPRFLLNMARKKLTGEDQSIGSSNSRLGPPEYSSIFNTDDKLTRGTAIQNAIPASKRTPGSFSAIDMGDRANVGGFFGPNADLNRSMQRTLASMDQSLKTIEKSVSATMTAQ